MQTANPCYPLAIFQDEEHKEENVDVEVQVSVTGKYNDTENVRFVTAPAITVASAIAKGSYEGMPAVFKAIAEWATDNNYSFDGAIFNIYHVSPADDPNPENWVTEVCYPVKKK
jgi:effector-binding domain-containing protein